MCELADSSIIAADRDGGPAQRVWLDGVQRPQALGEETVGASGVYAIGNDYLILHLDSDWVARTGLVAWKSNRMVCPFAASVVGDTALVTCGGCDGDGAAQVAQVNLQSGRVVGSFGQGTLKEPRGIDVCPNGSVFVADWDLHWVQVRAFSE